ncbi:hypothetical protein DL96DRAFT_1628705 [Flagelloscypha sp. PMI_526]|nr:hypothetical protein DL96DRAFT_1628705 [Flagelloscypha sp. PMI_526]
MAKSQTSVSSYLELLTDESKLDEAVKVLGDAFEWKFFYSGCDKSTDLVYESLLCYTKAAFFDGALWVAKKTSDDRIIGVAVWFGPGQKFILTDDQVKRCGWNVFLSKLSDNSRNWWPYLLERYDKGVDAILGKGVRLNSWHLQILGVHPDYQRNGVATKLCEYIEGKAREQGVLSVLEAPDPEKSKHIYQEKMHYEWKGATELIKSPEGVPSISFNVLTKA